MTKSRLPVCVHTKHRLNVLEWSLLFHAGPAHSEALGGWRWARRPPWEDYSWGACAAEDPLRSGRSWQQEAGYQVVTRCVASSSLLEQLHFSLLAVSVITRSPSFTRIQACAVVVDGDVMSLYGCISFFIPSSPRVVVPQFYDVNNNEVQPIRRCPQTCTDRIALTTTPFHPLLGLSDCLQPSNVFC